ncbi:hypothetical protein FGO68_gene6818 [Halteria grandinella]|uniref:SAM-dependent MTase RsmB/NOP-type domain-containing protein n=1 Tax=Halteria grandinella TaxID=5974 RepID=A0A8J8NNV7_HALGN|nr:hypothetical protein FGO68_gene6818 [Halteria grandinella]
MKVYQHAANVLTSIRTNNLGFKTAFYQYHEENKHEVDSYITRIYSIAINTYQQNEAIEEACQAMEGIEDVDDEMWDLLKVLVYEACVKGQRLRMGGRLPKLIKHNNETLKAVLSGGKAKDIIQEGTAAKAVPRAATAVYIRPNTHHFGTPQFSLGQTRKFLGALGFKVRKFHRLGLIRVIDNKLQGLCIATQPIIKNAEYMIQDLSSCLPVIFLRKYLEQHIFSHITDKPALLSQLRTLKALDATAAPGNKTLQLSEFVGEVLSYEKDVNRFAVLKKRVHECKASKMVTVINEDFLECNPVENPNLQDLDIILCDPSCSGSGMKLHSGHSTQSIAPCTLDIETPEDQLERAKNLGKFQFKILSKALNEFVNGDEGARFVVYSTCSIYREENEEVVRDVLKRQDGERPRWKTVDLTSVDAGISKSYNEGFHWNDELGCLRICASCGPKNYLNGFFLTIFERIVYDSS